MRISISKTGSIATLAEAKEQCHITNDMEDSYITTLIDVATSHGEYVTDTCFVETDVTEYHNVFRSYYVLSKQPATEIISVKVYDGETMAPFTDYKKELKQYGYSVICFGSTPPVSFDNDHTVEINYTCQIQRNQSVAKQLVLMVVAQLYEHRELEVTGTIVSKVAGYEFLVNCLKPSGA